MTLSLTVVRHRQYCCHLLHRVSRYMLSSSRLFYRAPDTIGRLSSVEKAALLDDDYTCTAVLHPNCKQTNNILSRIHHHLSRFMQDANPHEMSLLPPMSVRGMKTLYRDDFKKTVKVPSIQIASKSISGLSIILRKKMLHVSRVKAIADINNDLGKSSDSKLMLLDPEKCSGVESFSEYELSVLRNHNVDLSELKWFDLDLSYDNWGHIEILQAILPEESNSVAGFSSIGHILHLNLKDEVLEYKKIIGEVLLEKVSYAKTVVNKTNTIDNTYRNFSMEVLAGEENFMTTAKENGITFEFDFSQVYWNPRLGTEHKRIVNTIEHGDVVYDVFAGVGPFSLPALRRGATVFANDLNPASYRWLEHNAKKNRVHADRLSTHCLDGRAFIFDVVRQDLVSRRKNGDTERVFVLMNLPGIALEFLDALRGLLPSDAPPTAMMVTVHCYCFSKSDNMQAEVKERLHAVLGSVPEHEMRIVRNVAPKKQMLCITFVLKDDILLNTTESQHEGESEPPVKKLKAEAS